jgi:hypothetical protein
MLFDYRPNPAPQVKIISIKTLFLISYIDTNRSKKQVLNPCLTANCPSSAVLVWFDGRPLCGEKLIRDQSKVMRINEIAKDRSCTAIEKDPLHLLLEIERRFRAEERKNFRSKRGRSHQNLLRIIKERSG